MRGAAFLAAAAFVFGQEPLYRAGLKLVLADVVVTTGKSTVKGLTQDDFTVLDKGKSQKIAFFSINPPTAAANPQPLPANVVSNRIGFAGQEINTPTIVLYDRLNIPSTADQANFRSRLIPLLTGLKAGDVVGFYTVNTALHVVHDFDANPLALAQAARHMMDGSGAAQEDLDTRLKEAFTPQQVYQTDVRAETMWRVLQSIGRRLAGIPGRKNLVWIASDFPLIYGTSPDRRNNYDQDVARAVRILTEANVTLYTMDPRITGISADSSDSQPREAANMRGRVNAISTATGPGPTGLETMDKLTSSTGGRSYRYNNDVAADFRKILEESRDSYTIGFYAEEKTFDNRTHDINIKFTSKPETKGANAHQRKYYESSKTAIPVIEELAAEPTNASAIGLMGASGPDPSKPGVSAVQVRIDIGGLTFKEEGGKWRADMDLGMALDTPGGGLTPVSVKQIGLNLTTAEYQQGLKGGVVVDNSIPTPTKPSTLRLIVLDKLGGQAGSLRIPVATRN